ncbi:DUF2478 domain-containing protein [Roseovarius salis]|uniref:DUF2478 domain-containing protein n=1 Tax=Roseovarius salis TaxID=3376063 RepID=UPI0037CBEDA5
MKIGYVTAPGRGDVDRLLDTVARRLSARGVRLCGTVQINSQTAGGGPHDMDIRVLPDGPVLRISQSLGPGARGCRLDPEALERAVGLVSARLSEGADMLIVNKFGKQEAEGRGFRNVIAEALAQDVPVLVGLNGANRAAFQSFAAGLATDLPPRADALESWALSGGGATPATG